jgi:hypothetical protein
MRSTLAVLALFAVACCAAPIPAGPLMPQEAVVSPVPARDQAADDALIARALADADADLKRPSPPPAQLGDGDSIAERAAQARCGYEADAATVALTGSAKALAAAHLRQRCIRVWDLSWRP